MCVGYVATRSRPDVRGHRFLVRADDNGLMRQGGGRRAPVGSVLGRVICSPDSRVCRNSVSMCLFAWLDTVREIKRIKKGDDDGSISHSAEGITCGRVCFY